MTRIDKVIQEATQVVNEMTTYAVIIGPSGRETTGWIDSATEPKLGKRTKVYTHDDGGRLVTATGPLIDYEVDDNPPAFVVRNPLYMK